MTYFCTSCWKEIVKEEKICPYCGADQIELGEESYVKKLIKALNHPEPETPIRAAHILAELKINAAIPFLFEKLKTGNDQYITKALVSSILKIDPSQKPELIAIFKEGIPVMLKSLLK